MTRYTLDTVDIPLPGGAVLRVGVFGDSEGPVALTFTRGFVPENAIAPEGPTISVPVEALTPLKEALTELERSLPPGPFPSEPYLA